MVTVDVEPLDSADAQALIGELDDYLRALYPPEDNFLELPVADVFLMARDEAGQALGCVALRLLDGPNGGDAEVKRMYVRPSARGLGVGGRLLQEMTVIAHGMRARRLVLEVGARQVEALALYESLGFDTIPRFGPYVNAVNSRCLAKSLPDR